MSSFLALLALGILAYAATNVDDMLMLIAFFSDRRFTPRQVVFGQYLGMTLLIAASVFCSLMSFVLRPAIIGLLGFCPLSLGILQAVRGSRAAYLPTVGMSGTIKPMMVALVTVSNGGDNIGTYTPLFASMRGVELRPTIALFLLLTALWCAAAYLVVRHPRLEPGIRRYGDALRPWILIALGVSILVRTHALAILT